MKIYYRNTGAIMYTLISGQKNLYRKMMIPISKYQSSLFVFSLLNCNIFVE